MIAMPVMAGEKCGAAKKCTTPCVMSKIKTTEKATTIECIDKNGNKYEGKCADLVLNVDGMTCGGCESKIKTALNDVDGVVIVKAVSHSEKKAEICYNPDKVDSKKLMTLVADLGYKVKVTSDKVCDVTTCTGHSEK